MSSPKDLPRTLALGRRALHSATVLVANVFHACTQWAIVVILAKLGTPEDLGNFTLALAITAPLIFFFGLQHRTVLATDARFTRYFSDYLLVRLAGLLLCIIGVYASLRIRHFDLASTAAILAVLASKSVESILDLHHGLYQSAGQLPRQSLSTILRSTLGLLAFTVSYLPTQDLPLSIIAMAMSWLLSLLVFDVPSALRITSHRIYNLTQQNRRDRIGSLLRITFPLAFVGLLASLHPNIPRYVVAAHLGTEQLGVYAGLAHLMLIGNYLSTSVSYAFSDKLGSLAHNGELSDLKRLTFGLTAFAFSIGPISALVAAAAGPNALALIYNDSFAPFHTTLLILLLASGFSYAANMLRVSMTALHMNLQQSMASFISIAAALSFSFFLVPRFGIAGAAASILGSHCLQFLLLSLITRRAILRFSESALRVPTALTSSSQ